MNTSFEGSTPRRPVREGLFQLEPPRLMGSKCNACGTVVFPSKDFCPNCFADGPQEARLLEDRGTVFSYTVVHQAPGGRRTPYVLALIDLPDRVRVMAQVDVPVDQVSLGMSVRLDFREVEVVDGVSIVNYAFVADQIRSEVQ